MRLAKIFFYLFLISIPFGTRFLVWQFTPGFHEYEAAWIYASDIFLILFLLSTFFNIRAFKFQIPTHKSQTNSKFKIPKFQTLLLFTFLLFSLISIFFAPSTGLAIYSFGRFLLLVSMAFAVANLMRDKDIFKTTLAIIAALAVIQSLIGLAQFTRQENLGLQILGESPISSTDGASSKILVEGNRLLRAYGTFPHPNMLAAYLLLGLFSIYYLLLTSSYFQNSKFQITNSKQISNSNDQNPKRSGILNLRSWRLFGACGLVFGIFIILLGLVLTFSRAAWGIGILLTILFLIHSIFTKNSRKHGLKLFLIIVVSCLSLVVSLNSFILPRAQISLTEPAVSQRFTYNDLAIDLIKKNPPGVGIGNQVLYSVKNGVYQKFGMDKVWQWQPIHNLYLLIGAEIGVLGLLSFLMFLALLLISNFQFPISKQITNSNDQKLKRFGILNLKNWSLFGACWLEIGISVIMLLALLLFGFADHFLWTIWPGQIMLWLTIGIILGQKFMETDRNS